ncbi:MAG: LCP family protein [Lachnospiraceae bacterium]|nr:LCP family protein [Lachnospiraceae bacterium]
MTANSNQKNTRGNSSARKNSTKARETRKKTKIVVFAIEIIIILLMVAALYIVMTKTNSNGPSYTTLEAEDIIPDEVQAKKEEEGSTMQGYMNVALFGVDASTDSQLYKGSRSDSTMIASINLDTGDIKLVSIYRDTYLNLSNDSYEKCNAAYSYGGAEQAVKMLNMNLDMDIENFVTVGYRGLSEVIDGLGGIYIEVDSAELEHINNYQISIANTLKCDYTPVTETGYQLLDGIQATAYCRIRYTAGDDFKRASRQREVIMAIEEQAKKADLATLTKVFNSAVDDIYTSFSQEEILELLANISNYTIVEEDGFPQESMRTVANIGAKGSCVIPQDLESNVIWLHQFLFEDESYEVTAAILEYSDKIKSDTSKYIDKTY